MIRRPMNSPAGKVRGLHAAALIVIMAGTLQASARPRGLNGAPKGPGQRNAKPTGKQTPRPAPVLSAITPSSAPQGGRGELVLTGKNFSRGMELRLSCGHVPEFKVESAERAVAEIEIASDAPEGPCKPELTYIPLPRDETSPSPGGTPEVAPIPAAIKFTIANSAPMPAQLGEYQLYTEDEITRLYSLEASQRKLVSSYPKRTKEQEAQIKQASDKYTAQVKEVGDKFQQGKMTVEQFSKAMESLQPPVLLTPEEQRFAADSEQNNKKLEQLKEQGKTGSLHLKQGTISFRDENNTLFSEPLSGLREIAVVSAPDNKNFSSAFQMAFSSGKKYFFYHEGAQFEVVRLKKRLGR